MGMYLNSLCSNKRKAFLKKSFDVQNSSLGDNE